MGTYAFVNPVVALFLGWLGAGEAITLRTALAAAVILTAVLLVITAPHKNAIEAAEVLPNPGEAYAAQLPGLAEPRSLNPL